MLMAWMNNASLIVAGLEIDHCFFPPMLKVQCYNVTVEPCYNVVVGVHDFGPRCMRGASGVPISATRELINNSNRRPLHLVQELVN